MVKKEDLLVWLKVVDKDDALFVGGKSANLGEMIQAKFPVPNGFVISANAYFQFLEHNALPIKIKHLLGTVHFQDPHSLNQVSHHIKKLITTSEVPKSIAEQIFSYYSKLDPATHDPLVAIRSSATSEDSKTASFAGQQETYLNVKGDANVIDKVRLGWASLFEPRAIYYRNQAKLDKQKVGIALVVQKMVESDTSGIMFTIDPVTNNKSKIVIEAIYGLGEYIVQGKVTPDHYEVNKESLEILSVSVAKQDIQLKKVGSENKEIKIPINISGKQKISDASIISIAKLGKLIEKHYYFPQDIEWAIEDEKIYIVQTRPITTTLNKNAKQHEKSSKNSGQHYTVLLKGDPASPGIATGQVRIVKSPRDLYKVKKGEVLVAPFTNPDYVPGMKIASAIVTETGGRTSHAAIVSREFGIPAVVGAHDATKILHDGLVITVDGRAGVIYKGSVFASNQKSKTISFVSYKTATKIMVNLAEPERASEIARLNVDGIGLLRAEFMVAQIGIHPKKLIKEKRGKVFTDALTDGLKTICTAFYPRPVIYRATDFKTNEYRSLKGGDAYEPNEANPMIGFRGAFRYISDPAVFNLELDAIKTVRHKYNLTNLNLMIPFVRTVDELIKVKKLITNADIHRSNTFKLYMMVEVPSNVILLEEFIKVGIDGVSIGSNDLTMLLLGIDRDNENVSLEFDEQNDAVLWALERVVKISKKYGVDASICGQAPSNYPKLVEKLVSWGIHSISVSPDALEETRVTVHQIEEKLHIKV